MVFVWWARVVVRLRWLILLAAFALVAVGGTWGLGVFGVLSGGGFDDPRSPASRAQERIEQEVGHQEADVLALYSSPDATVDDPAFRDAVMRTLAGLRKRTEVESVTSYYETYAPNSVSAGRHATYVAIQLRDGDEDSKLAALAAVEPALSAPGLVTEVGGIIPFLRDARQQVESDLLRAELFSFPMLLILLGFIFGGLVAATTPMVVGVLAVLGGFVATRLIAQVTEVSTFAVNVITMLGLGMAIDYALFVVSRFREELAAGHDTPVAIATTLATAGRTVLVSGLTVALSLASLLLFPMAFLRSMGWGGMAAVLVAMLAALTVLPALLAVLGHRINALSWRRRSAARHRAGARPAAGAWERLARSVMRRPVWYAAAVVALLVALAAPFLRAEFGGFDERILPVGTPSRTVTERIGAEFPSGSVAPITVLVSGTSAAAAAAFAGEVASLPDVTDARVSATRGESSLILVSYTGAPTSEQARDVVKHVRALTPPDGAEVLVSGRPAMDLDQLDGLGKRLPWMALLAGGVIIVLLFFAFGSLVLPIKAVAMNVVSIGASFGVVVWVFQDGHLADLLGFTPTGFLGPTNLILLLAVVFGLSTDYEIFLLSRVREEWDRCGDNTRAVADGLQRTGGIITAAALLLIIVVAGFASGGMASIKTLGVGAVVAIVVDALLVRTLLVPATMRLVGRWNWWAPRSLDKLYRRYGLRETIPRSPSTVETEATVQPEIGTEAWIKTGEQRVDLNSGGERNNGVIGSFSTETHNEGLPIGIAAQIIERYQLNTQGYVAGYPEDLIRHYRAYVDQRSARRPGEEYREPTDAEWADFRDHFQQRKMALGTCDRPYATPCQHEFSCVRCPMLRLDLEQLPQLLRIESSHHERLAEARRLGWLGEVAAIEEALHHIDNKKQQAHRLIAQA